MGFIRDNNNIYIQTSYRLIWHLLVSVLSIQKVITQLFYSILEIFLSVVVRDVLFGRDYLNTSLLFGLWS